MNEFDLVCKLIFEKNDLLNILDFNNIQDAKKHFRVMLLKKEFNPMGIYISNEDTLLLHKPFQNQKKILTHKHLRMVNSHYKRLIIFKLRLPKEHKFTKVKTFQITLKNKI